MSVGLGFDAVNNDYKIICIVPEPGFWILDGLRLRFILQTRILGKMLIRKVSFTFGPMLICIIVILLSKVFLIGQGLMFSQDRWMFWAELILVLGCIRGQIRVLEVIL